MKGSKGAASDVCVVDEMARLGRGVLAGAGGDAARLHLPRVRVTGGTGAAEDEGVVVEDEGVAEDDEGFAEDEEVRRRVAGRVEVVALAAAVVVRRRETGAGGGGGGRTSASSSWSCEQRTTYSRSGGSQGAGHALTEGRNLSHMS